MKINTDADLFSVLRRLADEVRESKLHLSDIDSQSDPGSVGQDMAETEE